MDMWKGSTPTLAFKFPFKTNTINALTFKCKQGDSVKISKALSDFSTSGENILYILLTQADTLALISEEYVTVQFKVQFTNNHVIPSSKMILPVQDVIDTVAMDGTATAEAPTFAVDVPFPTIDGSFSVVMGMAVSSGGASSVAWTDITGKPETFPPSSHTHSKSQITDFPNIPTKTSDLTNDSGFLTSHQSLSAYRTASAQDVIDAEKASASVVSSHTSNSDIHVTVNQKTAWSGKQDAISDLSSIRSGASAGSTAVQPSAISDMATKTWVGGQGYLTEHQSLSGYATQTWVNQRGFLTSVDWTSILNKPQTFTPSAHNHDDRYYTESEADSRFLRTHQDISGKEDKSNKVTSMTAKSTDTQYPSAKAVYDEISQLNEDLADKVEYTDKLSSITGSMTDAEKNTLWSRQSIIKTSMDAVAVVGAQYYLGEKSSLSITMPSSALVGQQIIVCFSSGATACSLTCDLTGFSFVPKANKTNKITFTCIDATSGNMKWIVETEES